MFDVAMGSYDGAEVCELLSLYIPHKLTTAFLMETSACTEMMAWQHLENNTSARSLDKARKVFFSNSWRAWPKNNCPFKPEDC